VLKVVDAGANQHIPVYTYVQTYTGIHLRTHVYRYTLTYTRIPVYTYVHTYTGIHLRTHVYYTARSI